MTPAAGCELCALLAGSGDDVAGAAPLWRDGQVAVVLVDDPAYPGFCRVIWNGHVKEMTDLDAAERGHIMDIVWRVEQAVRAVMQPEKVNLASFGNMTPHVHWHVIPRYRDDAHFPHPSWAVVQRETRTDVLKGRRALLPQLRAAIIQGLTGLQQPVQQPVKKEETA